MTQAHALRVHRSVDHEGLREFLEEAAEEIMSKVTSQMVNLMAHVMKVVHTRNPEVIGHWRSEIVEFRDQFLDAYRPSMRQAIERDREKLWQRAKRKVIASFRDHGEPEPALPELCPFSLDMVTDESLEVEDLVKMIADPP
jgi:hypothetical protein